MQRFALADRLFPALVGGRSARTEHRRHVSLACGSDGTLGLRAIKEKRRVERFVQSPASAKFDSDAAHGRRRWARRTWFATTRTSCPKESSPISSYVPRIVAAVATHHSDQERERAGKVSWSCCVRRPGHDFFARYKKSTILPPDRTADGPPRARQHRRLRAVSA